MAGFLLVALCPSDARADASLWERMSMAFARRAFQDGLYDVAQVKLERFTEERSDSELLPEACWLLAQCHFFQGDYPRALEYIERGSKTNSPDLRPEFLYWRGQTLMALNRPRDAAQAFESFLKDFPEHEKNVDTRLGIARARFQLEGLEPARKALEPLLADPKAPAYPRALLQLARLQLTASQFPDAVTSLETLKNHTLDETQRLEVSHWLGRAYHQLQRHDEALATLHSVLDSKPDKNRPLIAETWFALGGVLQSRSQWKEAAEAFEKSFQLTLDSRLMESAILDYLQCQNADGNLARAAQQIRKFAGQGNPNAVVGLLAIGRYYLEAGNSDAALSELDNLAQNFPDSRWVWPARLLIARAFLARNDSQTALETLDTIRTQTKDPDAALDATHLLADHLYEKKDYARAAGLFSAYLSACQDPAKREHAAFCALNCHASLKDLAAFDTMEKIFRTEFPNSPSIIDVLMLKARLYETAGQDDQARALYAELANTHPSSPQAGDALCRLGFSNYEQGAYAEAVAALQAVEQNHPQHPQLDRAIYCRILSQLALGQLTASDACKQLDSLGSAFPKSPLLPSIRLQAAQALMDQQRFAEASTAYQQLTKDFPGTGQAQNAAYLAGRCAMALGNHKEAISLLEAVPDTSLWKPHARLAQLRCYMLLGNHTAALKIADAILKDRKPDDLWIEANLRRAECLYTLAAQDPALYQDAFVAAESVIRSDSAGVAARNEAGYLKGMILQHQNKNTLALEAFLDVVYCKLLPPDVTQQPPQPELHFFIQSGLAAAQMCETSGNINAAVEIYRILERLGDPHRQSFRRRIEDLKARHFIYEES